MSENVAPKTIYLQNWSDDPDVETTWCKDKINDDDVTYIRFDLVLDLMAAAERLMDFENGNHHKGTKGTKIFLESCQESR